MFLWLRDMKSVSGSTRVLCMSELVYCVCCLSLRCFEIICYNSIDIVSDAGITPCMAMLLLWPRQSRQVPTPLRVSRLLFGK